MTESGRSLPLWPQGAPGATGSGDQPTLKPFLLDGPGPHACVIVCPGGGYSQVSPPEGDPVAQWLNSIGVSSAVLTYRVAPHRHPIPLADAQRAIRFVRAHAAQWNIDPGRVGILGFSAGGHLACCTATIFDATPFASAADPIDGHSSRPDALIACYAVITMLPPFAHAGSRSNLLGAEFDQGLVESLSLENRVSPQTPPTFLWSTSDDGAVPVENSVSFAMALRRNKVPFALHCFAKGDHGLGLATDKPSVGAWTNLCAQWLRDIGFAPKPA